MSGNKVQRLAEIDNQMAGEHRHIHEVTGNFNLQPHSGGIEDRDKTVIGVRAQPQVWVAGVVVNKV